MVDEFGHVYQLHTPSHKFGFDGLAEFVYERIIMNGDEDEFAGDGEGEWIARIGKRVMKGSSDGSVSLWRWDSVAQSMLTFNRVENEMCRSFMMEEI